MKKIYRAAALFFAATILSGCTSLPEEEVITSTAPPVTTFATAPAVPEEPEEDKPPKYIEFFGQEKVHNIYIDIDEENWKSIFLSPEDEEYYSSSVNIDGAIIENIGIRTKGNSSLKHGTWQGLGRFPFHIKFDEYVKDQNFLGLDDLVLNNCTDDPSYIREYYGYEAFRQLGMDVPLVTFFNVYVNGELLGFYLGVEVIDSSYLDRVYGNHKESLYKASEGATLEADMDISLLEGKKGAPEDKSDVIELINIINSTPISEKGNIEEVLDVDTVLKYFATCAVIHNWDDYCGWFSQNYYFYKNEGKFTLIPWDINESFFQTQAYYNASDGARQDIASPVTGWASIQRRPMAEKLLSVPEYYEKYLLYCETLSDWLDTILKDNKLNDTYELIKDSIYNDPSSFFGTELFELQFDPEYSEGICGFITERVAYLKERLPELMNQEADQE